MTRDDPVAFVRAFGGDPSIPDVWVLDVREAGFADLAEAGPHTVDERQRAAELSVAGAGQALLARRAAVRRILALYLGRDPDDVRLVTLPGGKPTFVPLSADRHRLAYSSGHSGDLFCMAVGTASSLGVDVEVERSVPRALSIAGRWFSEEEAAPLGTLDGARRDRSFLRLWTGKEALAKRHAAGLRLMTRARGDLEVEDELARGTLTHLVPADGYVGALAASVPIADVRVIARPDLAGGSP